MAGPRSPVPIHCLDESIGFLVPRSFVPVVRPFVLTFRSLVPSFRSFVPYSQIHHNIFDQRTIPVSTLHTFSFFPHFPFKQKNVAILILHVYSKRPGIFSLLDINVHRDLPVLLIIIQGFNNLGFYERI